MPNSDKLGSGLLAELGNGCPHHLMLGQVKSSNHTFKEPVLFCLHQKILNSLQYLSTVLVFTQERVQVPLHLIQYIQNQTRIEIIFQKNALTNLVTVFACLVHHSSWLSLGTRLFEDPVNLLRTVVVALNKDGILDPPSSHLLTSLFYRMRPVHRSLIKKGKFLERDLFISGCWADGKP